MKVNDVFDIKILDVDIRGNGIARIDGFVVFIPFALKDEIVKIKIIDIKKRYAKGMILEIISKSNDRTNVDCPHFFKCGGCKFLHTKYENELLVKYNFLEHLFPHIKIKKIISGPPFSYRNKVTFHVQEGKLGFYKEETNDLIPIDNCLLLSDNIMKLVKELKKCDLTNVNKIMIRESNTTKELLLVIFGSVNKKTIDKIKNFKNLTSFYINDTLIYGEYFLEEDIFDKKFMLGPKSFFQVNYEMMLKIYEKVKEYVDTGNNLLDLYCGIGTITLHLANKVDKVYGIEIVDEAIKLANKIKELNNISNATFKCDDVANLKKGSYDKIVVDPPRKGLDKKTINKILEIEPRKIVYVSCNPLTLKRDIELLKTKYEVLEISPFDMFPKTNHVECVCVLRIKENFDL